MLLEGGTKTADEGVEAAPGLAQWAGAGGGRVRMAEEGAELGMDFGLPKLVKVPQKFKDMGPAAAVQRKRRAVIAEILAEGIPVSALLVLIAAESGGRRS